jgi:hypothetical protein
MPAIEILGQAQRRNDLQRFIEPTIFIGLGGTGKEVLLRIRRRFFERFGTIGYPILGYLWVDTNLQEQNIEGQDLNDHIAEEARFRAEEMVNCEVPAQEFSGYFSKAQSHPNIFSWMYPEVAKLGSVVHGARGVRPLGRLGFFHNFNLIRQRMGDLKTKIQTTENREIAQTRYGLEVGNTPKIVLVCSLAGGTGSGMFLDMAFFCRLYFNNPQPDIVGYLLLPSVFAPVVENNEPVYGNAYAALKELEFYSMRKDFLRAEATAQERIAAQQGQNTPPRAISAHDFEVNWTNSKQVDKIPGPPFNTCYLVDNKPNHGGEIGLKDKGQLCDMIAESIFADYSNHDFAAYKRSVRSNLDDYLGNELKYDYLDTTGQKSIHSEVFSCRFSTMGFSKIYIPSDRIKKACAYRFASDLLNEFLRENELSGDVARLLQQDEQPEIKLRPTDFAPLEKENDSGNTFSAVISKYWNEEFAQEMLTEARSRAPELPKKFQDELEKYARLFAEPAEREKWGGFIRRLRIENQPAFLKATQQRILERTKLWLDTPRLRFKVAVEYLQQLNVYLDVQAKDFRDRAEGARQAEKELQQDVLILCNYMKDERNGLWVHHRALRALVQKACECASEMFRSRIRARVMTSAEEICRSLQAYIGKETYIKLPDGSQAVERAGLIQTVATLREELVSVRDEIERKLAAFERVTEHLIFENLYQPGMFRNYYKLKPHASNAEWQNVDLRKNEDQLRDEELRFRQSVRITTLYDLLERFQEEGGPNVERYFTAYAESRFQGLDINADALKLFYEKYEGSNKVDERITRFVLNASPWLSPSIIATTENVVQSEEAVEFGISANSSSHVRYQQFVQQVRNQVTVRLPGTTLGAPVAIDPDTIAFYTEMAGIPLLYVNRLAEYAQAYVHQLLKQKPLHLTRNQDRFADILPKKAEEVESTIRINEVLLVGTILHTLDLEQAADGEVIYAFRNEELVPPRKIPLGRYNMAMETLHNSPGDFEVLSRKTQLLREQLDLESRKQFLAVLASQIEDGTRPMPGTQGPDSNPRLIAAGPFPPRFLTVGARSVLTVGWEHEALSRVIAQETEKLQHMANLAPEKTNDLLLDLYRTLDNFSEPVRIGKIMMRRMKNPQRRSTVAASSSASSQGAAVPAVNVEPGSDGIM